MKLVVWVLCTVVFFSAVLDGRLFIQGIESRNEIRHEVFIRCLVGERAIRILRQEHIIKLREARRNVRKYPRGVVLRTNGGRIKITHAALVANRRLEARIVRQTKPRHCPPEVK